MSENKKEIANGGGSVRGHPGRKIIVVIDDPDRENEGDLICAARICHPGKCKLYGLLCQGADLHAHMSRELCEKLGLEQMVSVNTDNHSTAFTVSIDHVDTTTGISAYELFCHCHESSGG